MHVGEGSAKPDKYQIALLGTARGTPTPRSQIEQMY